jgi:HME family heavy-metal exporter
VEAGHRRTVRQPAAGHRAPRFLFRRRTFIEAALGNVEEALRDGAILVAVDAFRLSCSTPAPRFISLVAIPCRCWRRCWCSAMGLSINTMTLGGLAIAIGELVDDAVVDVENVLRRLKENRQRRRGRCWTVIAGPAARCAPGWCWRRFTVVLVFVPLFALPGMEGRLFVPLGLAYIVSILASMAVAVTVTPVLCLFLLPGMPQLGHGDSFLVTRPQGRDRPPAGLGAAASGRVLVAARPWWWWSPPPACPSSRAPSCRPSTRAP